MTKKHKKHHKSDKALPEEKPGIKLVLKVSTPDQAQAQVQAQGENPPAPSPIPLPPQPTEDSQDGGDRKHKHKKKKKKHKHHRDDQERKDKRKSDKLEEMAPSDVDEDTAEPPAKRQALEEAADTPVSATSCDRSLRERKPIEDETTPLQRCLDMIHKLLLRKDLNGFFAYPVTDNIAPSYSKIIQNPMDLSTIAEKLESNDYQTLLDYKADFRLMCENCMTYNHPETIYYKEAEKMLKTGLRIMSKDKMIQMKRNTPFMGLVNDHELGFDQDHPGEGGSLGGGGGSKLFLHKPKVKKPAMTKFEAFPDRLTPEQILAQAQDAAKDAAEQLTLRKPHTKFGFIRRREDGSTTLKFLNPENDGIVSEKERVVNLGTLLGKVQNGTGTIPGFKEDKRNKASPMNYLSYGPYSTYAPVYDSSQCNLSKEESDLLLSTYGDDAGTQYAYSVRHFVADTGDYAVRMVDQLLDVITAGEHSKALGILKQVEESQKENAENPPAVEGVVVKTEAQTDTQDTSEDVQVKTESEIDYNSLRSLTDIGIDVAFVDSIEERLQKERELQEKLDKTSQLLKDLQKTQYDRLSQSLPSHLAHVPGPDSKEQELAGKVTHELSDLVKQAAPSEIIVEEVVRDAIGVTLDPVSDLEEEASQLAQSVVTEEADLPSPDQLPAAAAAVPESVEADDATQPESVENLPNTVMGSPPDVDFDFVGHEGPRSDVADSQSQATPADGEAVDAGSPMET